MCWPGSRAGASKRISYSTLNDEAGVSKRTSYSTLTDEAGSRLSPSRGAQSLYSVAGGRAA